MGQTIAEKIFSARTGESVRAGQIVIAPVDYVYTQDGSRPQVPDVIEKQWGGAKLSDTTTFVGIIDHHPNDHHANAAPIHANMYRFAEENGTVMYPAGRGILNLVFAEEGQTVPGRILLANDSHTVTGGAFNCLATGVGATDLVVAAIYGKTWFMVPETMRIDCRGRFGAGVYAKDLILHLINKLGADGATYLSVEYVGEAIDGLSMEGRMTISNMSVEMGAKFALMEADDVTRQYLAARGVTEYETYASDPDAEFVATHEVDVSELEPMVAVPPDPAGGVPVGEVVGVPIHQATIGTCTNSQLEDLRAAAAVLGGNKIHPRVRLFVTAGTREAYLQALKEGLIEQFVEAGAVLGTPGCGGCQGSSAFGIPADGDNAISTANRNFAGRTGNPNAHIYLASPATVMASAVQGAIADPRDHLARVPVGA